MSRTTVAYLLWLVLAGVAFSQDVTVQQPIVGTISVSTSAAVPDRGRVFLGACLLRNRDARDLDSFRLDLLSEYRDRRDRCQRV